MQAKIYGGYSQSSTEGIENATDICNYLMNRGWSLNAVCGLLGNIAHEGGLNPWRWYADEVKSVNDYPWTNIGYGFTQFTPASKYISDPNAQAMFGYSPNFIDQSGTPNDGYAQLQFVDLYADYNPTRTYPISYSDFKTSNYPADYLASAWLYNYERPLDPSSTEQLRRNSALYFYNDVFHGQPPQPVITKRKLPIWVYKPKYRIERR